MLRVCIEVFHHQKGKLRHSAAEMLLTARSCQLAPQKIAHPPHLPGQDEDRDVWSGEGHRHPTWDTGACEPRPAWAGAPRHPGLSWGCEKASSPPWQEGLRMGVVLLPGGTRVGPLHPSVCGGDDVHHPVPASAWPMQRVGRGLCPPAPGLTCVPPPCPRPGPTHQSLLLKRLGEYGGWKAMPAPAAPLRPLCSPLVMPALPTTVSPLAGWVAGTAWVLAASRGRGHGVNTLGDDLSCAQSALSGAGGPACHPEPRGC